MANAIANILQIPALVSTILKNIRIQQKFIGQRIEPLINEAAKLNDGSLDEEAIKKLKSYYGLAVPAILGEAFCALRGYPMSSKERLASTCQGATTGLFDDFFDKQNFTGEELKKFILDPASAKANTASQQLFLQLYTTGLLNMPNQTQTLNYVQRVYMAQVESKKQNAPGLSFEEIKRITMFKGGVSLLLYRTAFDNQVGEPEIKMLEHLGGLMQLSNDIFDVYEDSRDGIHTLVTTSTHISSIKILFRQLLKEGYDLCYASGYPEKNVKKFINIISIGVFSRAIVCLDQLESKEKLTGNVFMPHSYQRKDLICDMDTLRNKMRSLQYHIQTS